MEFKNVLKAMFVLFVVAALFSGCSSKKASDDIKVESDEVENTQVVTEIVPETKNDTIENIVQEELIVNDTPVEIGELI